MLPVQELRAVYLSTASWDGFMQEGYNPMSIHNKGMLGMYNAKLHVCTLHTAFWVVSYEMS